MKRVTLLFVALLASTAGLAGTLSPSMSALGTAWKSYHALHAKYDKNDVEMVYGGADITFKPVVNQASTAA